MFLLGGCTSLDAEHQGDEYEYLIGVSVPDVMESWLNNMLEEMKVEVSKQANVNLLFRDAAQDSETQKQDIEQLLNYGIDLLVVIPTQEAELRTAIAEAYEKIPVIIVGEEPKMDAYTTYIHLDNYWIGEAAAKYIVAQEGSENKNIVVFEGAPGSTISDERKRGFESVMKEHIPAEQLYYYDGEWIRDKAEDRMKDFVVLHKEVDVVFAFNDQMAYGAYIACEKLRVDNVNFIGVDGFSGEGEGLEMIERGILEATIKCPQIGHQSFQVAMSILDGEEVEKDIMIPAELVTK